MLSPFLKRKKLGVALMPGLALHFLGRCLSRRSRWPAPGLARSEDRALRFRSRGWPDASEAQRLALLPAQVD